LLLHIIISFFLTISVSHLLSASTGRIFTGFSTFGFAIAVDDQSEPRFLIFQGILPWQPTFVFPKFRFFAVTQNLLPVFTTPSGPICSKSTRPIFAVFSPDGSPTGVDNCCKIGLLCHGNKYSSFSDIFHRSGRYFCDAQSPFVRFVYSSGLVIDSFRIVELLRS